MTKNDSQMSHKQNTQDDSHEQALADATWTTLSDGESFADSLRQSLDQDLPDRDATLKDRLSEQLLSESDSTVESKVALSESKLPLSDRPSSNRIWTRLVAPVLVAAACICLGAFLAIGYMVKASNQNAKQLAPRNMQLVDELLENRERIEEASKVKDKQLANENAERVLRVQQLEGRLQDAKKNLYDLGEALDESKVKADTAFNVVSEAEKRIKRRDGLGYTPPASSTFTMRGFSGDGPIDSVFDGPSPRMVRPNSLKSFNPNPNTNGQLPNYDQWGPKSVSPTVGEDRFEADYKGFGESDDDNGDGYFEPSDNQSRERYNPIFENPFIPAQGPAAISTFSIDVDTASYSNMRRFLNLGQLPPRDSVRIEELINYFDYDYPQPKGDDPFSVDMEVAPCPWSPGRRLLRVGLQGKEIHRNERPTSNLVFLVDVSGSMQDNNKLPLLKRGLQLMVNQLSENDRVSIVTYAGNAGVVLKPTHGDQKKVINEAIERLTSGGSTHGSAGIEKAYDLAVKNRVEGGTNRVIWATDGDLNVGITDDETLVNLVAERAKEGIFLTTLGFGTGNLQDGKLEQIANKGNGIYGYIDSFKEAQKVLVQQMSGSLVTIAKDVKLQIEFNPTQVAGYRLIGYENRMLATEDFDNDTVDAGEIGAGHRVTAIYELQMKVAAETVKTPETKLKYQNTAASVGKKTDETEAAFAGELLTLALRYKQPEASESKRIEFVLNDVETRKSFDEASDDFRFAASVASFGMLLRQSKYHGDTSADWVIKTAAGSLGEDRDGYRAEFIDLVRKAQSTASNR